MHQLQENDTPGGRCARSPDMDQAGKGMPDKRNHGVCRVCQERQGRCRTGMPDKLQQRCYGRDGQQDKGREKEYV